MLHSFSHFASLLMCHTGAKSHRKPIVRADHVPNALEVPEVDVTKLHAFLVFILVPVSTLMVVFVFIMEQVGLG